MTLIIETGAGIEDANSYVTVAEADAYFEARGGDEAWAQLTEPQKEGKLIEAADFMNAFYRPKGLPYDMYQTMALPTDTLNYIPPAFKWAQIQLAKAAVNGPLAGETTGGAVIKLREKLDGVGETETEYAAATGGGRAFPMIESMLRGFIVLAGQDIIKSGVVRLG